MARISISIVQSCDSEAGVVVVKRIDGPMMREMGNVKFESDSDKKWLLGVLMDMHPYVTLSESQGPCDPEIKKDDAPC